MEDALERTLALLSGAKRHYQFKFQKPHDTDFVLRDLATFCGINEDRQFKDVADAAYWAGRRSAFLRIQRFLNLSTEELFQLYNGLKPRGESK